MSTRRSFADYPEKLTSEQVADLLGHPPKTIPIWVREGKLPAQKEPGSRRWWFDRDELIAWLRSETRVTPAAE